MSVMNLIALKCHLIRCTNLQNGDVDSSIVNFGHSKITTHFKGDRKDKKKYNC